MAYGNVNVSGPTQSEIEGVQQNIDDVKEVIGQTTNTGGTLTAGTVMAKLNKLLTDWTNVRAGKIDTINTNAAKLTDTRVGYIDKLANFGATTDTGGTATAGTVMAKLNKLLTDWTNARAIKLDNIGTTGETGGSTSAGTVMAKLNKLLTDWTNTRAGKIDTINSAIGTTANTGGTATAGTMMAKLNALITANSKGLKVKRIQRGFASNASQDQKYYTNDYREINISEIDLTKTVLITDTSGNQWNSTYGVTITIPYISSTTKIRQYRSHTSKSGDTNYNVYPAFNWSIIEFE